MKAPKLATIWSISSTQSCQSGTAIPVWVCWEMSRNIYVLNISTLWLFNIAMENPLKMEVLMGKSSINGPFSMAMLNNQRVNICCCLWWLFSLSYSHCALYLHWCGTCTQPSPTTCWWTIIERPYACICVSKKTCIYEYMHLYLCRIV